MITEKWSNLELDEWIAGVLDGDGHKSLSAIKSGEIANMNDREALESMHLRIGGEIVIKAKKGDNTRKDGTGATYTKDFYQFRWGKQYNGTKDVIPQSIARHMLDAEGRARYYTGNVRSRSLTPSIPWFAGYFVAEGWVNVGSKTMNLNVKDKRMLGYWLDRYGGNIHHRKDNGLWHWYNHTRKTAYIINELAPYITWDKRRKMMELWNHYVGKIQ